MSTHQPPVSNTNCIELFIHCGRCFDEKPSGISMRDFASLELGWTKEGFQVWCKRHDCNVLHVDFEGQQHPANTTALRPSATKETVQ